ncbi:MAG: hypothetical protein HOH82_09280 [Planctomycetaceae bacterium]|nr:hypothetical protein [Planctomycetaceae bacterium]
MPTSSRVVITPTSRCRFGIGRVDITPPVGIYHRFWGAASHDQATGVHRPLTATAVILQPLDAEGVSELHVLIAIDHCLFRDDDMQLLRDETARLIEVDAANITFTFSHTHSGGHICRARADQPGGEMIGPYLDGLPGEIGKAFRSACDSLRTATLSYGQTTCNMGRHRDFWDETSSQFVCGFNPDLPMELPLDVVRATAENGDALASIVNYSCHPTTLAWDNTLISPDYIGALREVVEQATDVPCVFLQGPSGDIGPRDGFVGDTEVADRNGRQVGYAALSLLESMPAPEADYRYNGPVISGATIGEWEYAAQDSERQRQTSVFRHRHWDLSLPYRTELQTVEQGERELNEFLAQEQAARENGDNDRAADQRALAERSRRLLERLQPLPPGDYPFSLDVWQMGDAFWVAVEGEPYHALQQELNCRFPQTSIIVIELANGSRCSYLPTREAYGKSLYQVDIALLTAGCLERITDELATQIECRQGERGA